MDSLYSHRDNCRLCGSKNIDIALRLAPMPIATPNMKVPGVDSSHRVFREAVPLDLFLCRHCGLLQLLRIGNPGIQYANYVYTTSLSLGLPQHFENYAAEVLAALTPTPGALVVEIGSNDGTLLRHFKQAGMRVLGVDPAADIACHATESGIETLGDFFTDELAAEIRAGRGPAAVMIANNVIANIDDLNDIVQGVRTLLGEEGVFVFETQYGADVVEKNLLDTIYHEHLSYFNVKPLVLHFARHGLEVFDVRRIGTKGGSIRVFVQHKNGSRPIAAVVADMMSTEEARGHYQLDIYHHWDAKITVIRRALADSVAEQRKAGRLVGGYGVSVGTTTLMAQFGVTDKIDVLFDDDPNKDPELIGPGYSIPVMPAAGVYEKSPGSIIVFAWRYAEPIIAKHQRYLNQGGKFIIPLPSVTVR
jgi:hypothetical protein